MMYRVSQLVNNHIFDGFNRVLHKHIRKANIVLAAARTKSFLRGGYLHGAVIDIHNLRISACEFGQNLFCLFFQLIDFLGSELALVLCPLKLFGSMLFYPVGVLFDNLRNLSFGKSLRRTNSKLPFFVYLQGYGLSL